MPILSRLENSVEFLVGSADYLTGAKNVSPLEIFSCTAIDFWSSVSSRLLADARVKNYPDVVTFAFFCRKSNITSISRRYINLDFMCGRGVIFHIAPSNVPVNFAYSLLMGLLAGNVNIVRVSKKFFPQVALICQVINEILTDPKFFLIAERIYIIQYPRCNDINQYFSSLADARLIWGGDEAISDIRRAHLNARSNDLTFADRYSMTLINANAVLLSQDIKALARNFYNDTYLFDQNACSSPRLVIWSGKPSDIKLAQQKFWSAVQVELTNYKIDSVRIIDKLTTLCEHSGDLSGVHLLPRADNKLWRVAVDDLNFDLINHRCSSGYFLEHGTSNLMDLKKIVTRKHQTLSYYGFQSHEILAFIKKAGFLGIDRVVPIGRTTEFNPVWDGHDLIRELSREITIF